MGRQDEAAGGGRGVEGLGDDIATALAWPGRWGWPSSPPPGPQGHRPPGLPRAIPCGGGPSWDPRAAAPSRPQGEAVGVLRGGSGNPHRLPGDGLGREVAVGRLPGPPPPPRAGRPGPCNARRVGAGPPGGRAGGVARGGGGGRAHLLLGLEGEAAHAEGAGVVPARGGGRVRGGGGRGGRGVRSLHRHRSFAPPPSSLTSGTARRGVEVPETTGGKGRGSRNARREGYL